MEVSEQQLSHWIGAAFALAYSSRGLMLPSDLRAHSIRSLSSFWALYKGGSQFRKIVQWPTWPPLTRLQVHSMLSVVKSL